MVLSKDDILKAQDGKTKDVEVPAWGGSVRLKSFSAKKRKELFSEFNKFREEGTDPDFDTAVDFQIKLICACIVDDQGKPCFTKDDFEALSEKDSKVLESLFQECVDLNALGENVSVIQQNLE